MADAVAVSAPRSTRAPSIPLVGAFMFGHFTHHVTNTLLAPLLPLIRDSFGLTYTQSGFLVSAFSVTGGFSQAPIGALADRIGSRTVVTGGLILSAVFCFLIGLSGSYWHLLFALIGLGLVAGSYHAPANTLLSQIFPRDRLGGVLGFHIVGGNASFFVTPLLAGTLAAATMSWRTPYLAFAIAPLVAGLALMFVLPRGPERTGVPSSPAAIFGALRGVFRVIGPLLSVAVVFQMLYIASLAFLALYLVDARGFDTATAAFFVSVPFIGGMFGSPLGGMLSDRLGRRPLILGSLVVMGPIFLALTLVPNELIFPVLALLGLVSSARMPVIEGLILDRAPEGRRATTLGAYYFVGQEFGGIAAPLIGALAMAIGIGQAFGALGLLLVAMSAGIFALQRKL